MTKGTVMSHAIWLIALLCLLLGCKSENEDNPVPPGLQFVYGDTLYIIPDSARAYAGSRDAPNHFDSRAYIYAEYLVAIDTLRAREVYHGDFQQWSGLSWDERYPHLPTPFTHDVMTPDSTAYYFAIGMFFRQFGWGWQDTYNNGSGYSPSGIPDWSHPAAGLRPDTTRTIQFDGDSPRYFHYRDMFIKRPR